MLTLDPAGLGLVELGLFCAATATATLSGTLGMGGGLLLMGVLATLLPPAEALALHGVAQLASNGSRAAGLREHVELRIMRPYFAGALTAAGLFSLLAVAPSPALLFFTLGLLPWISGLLPERLAEPITIAADRPRAAGLCGFAVGTLQLIAGVSGSLLDLFFLNSPVDRRGIVATKAATQTLAHGLKLLVMVPLLPAATALSPLRIGALVLASWLGSRIGRRLLESLSERDFRRAGDRLLKGVGVLYLLRSLSLALA